MIKFEPFVGDPLSDTQVSVERFAGASIVRLECTQLAEMQSALLGRHLGELATRTGGRLVVDVSRVEKFSCSWLNELISVAERCGRMGGGLAVFGFGVAAARMLRTTRLDRRVHVAHDENEALAMVGCGAVSSWRLAVARALSIPVAEPRYSKAA